MLIWIKKNKAIIVSILVCILFSIYCYGCEPQVKSLTSKTDLVNRQELQLELDQIITMAQLRMASLDQQDKFRAVVLQNALILVQGQPLNPLGIITAIASVYGIMQGSSNITKVVKEKRIKKRENNG